MMELKPFRVRIPCTVSDPYGENEVTVQLETFVDGTCQEDAAARLMTGIVHAMNVANLQTASLQTGLVSLTARTALEQVP